MPGLKGKQLIIKREYISKRKSKLSEKLDDLINNYKEIDGNERKIIRYSAKSR